MSTNPTPPTILRNLYAKLETMEKELNETTNNSPSSRQGENQKVNGTPMSPLTLPSNSNNPSDVKKYNAVVDKMSKLSMNDPRQEYDYPKPGSSRRGGSYSDKDNEYNSPKINYVRAAPTPPAINTYYNPQNQRYANHRGEEDNLEASQNYDNDIPRYYTNNNYNNGYPQQNYPAQYEKMSSPNGNSFAFSPDSAAFYNEMSIPNIDEYGNYVSDYKHQSDYSGKEFYMNQRQSEYSVGNVTKSSISNSFDLNADLEAHAKAKSFGGSDSLNESFSDSKSFLAAAAEIDMNFDASILSGKKPKLMKDLVNSNNFHKGGQLTICTNILFNKKKTLFYALTTHRLYAFKEDRSDAELITHYTIDKDAKVTKAGIYAGVRNFELTTIKNHDKQREIHEFECATKEEKDEWLHAINKVIQLHKYHDKTLPPPPSAGGDKKNESYTSTLKTPNMKPGYPTPAMSPETPGGYANSSFSGSSYKSPTTPNAPYNTSTSSQGSFSKVSPMYGNPAAVRRNSPQPMMVQSPTNGKPMNMKASPNMGATQPNYYRSQKNLPINQLINNPPPVQGRNPPQSPRVNYYQRSPMQRPQGN